MVRPHRHKHHDILPFHALLLPRPPHNPLNRLPPRLRHVLPTRVHPLAIPSIRLLVLSNPHREAREPRPAVYPSVFLRELSEDGAAHGDGVAWLGAGGVVRGRGGVDDFPSSVLRKIIRPSATPFYHPFLRSERVPGEVRLGPGWGMDGDDVGLEERVGQAIDHGVDAQGEEVLVVVCVDGGRDGGAVGVWLAGGEDVDLEDAGEADFELDGAVLVEAVVPDVFWEAVIQARLSW